LFALGRLDCERGRICSLHAKVKNPWLPSVGDFDQKRIVFAVLLSIVDRFFVTISTANDLGLVTG